MLYDFRLLFVKLYLKMGSFQTFENGTFRNRQANWFNRESNTNRILTGGQYDFRHYLGDDEFIPLQQRNDA